ncbi:cyclopropane-fatty-acyl-phospholipid synthase family protein [Paraburkholderia sp. DHOC27]|uniref:SAM-dependent methyltransferase n=1 Tax=Paraburkholderia sp. DHOC27 TaxID=2303330 RepID=UPI000E3C66F7|nr:cyclopropane-fatty-acyl-phospholipid synthase family protein [Paraburkholderia sp. DHOC27]RFU46843.1 class I SAM-dependent methyltransferase [Paraburkholderia sp. DHOC27]
MTLSRTLSGAQTAPASGRLFLSLLERIREGHLVLVTPDGQQRVFGDPHAGPGARLELKDWRACGAILRKGDIGFAEAWRLFWVETPDLAALLRVAIRNERALQRTVYGGWLAQVWYGLRHRLRRNSRSGSRRNIHAHYDIGNGFYKRWLDPSFTYSSAVFDGDFHTPLETAQHAKYQRIIDTLGLRPGMRVLEIGCGWGGFAIHAARQGIHVHGVTISAAQLEFAQLRAAEARVLDSVHLELRDYRSLTGQYDGIVSIEMFEAVGEKFWPAYFRILRERLAPGAKALVQTITIDEAHFVAYRATSDFIREYIFPGGMLPSPQRFMAAAKRGRLAANVTLAFGRDYAETLRRWRHEFEMQLDAIRAQGFDETFVRTWRLYLAYCEAGFDEGRTDVMHFVLQSAN